MTDKRIGAWIEVEHGDVQRTHPEVPRLPDGRYVAVDALLSDEAVEGGFQRVFGSLSVEAVDQTNRTLVRDILTAVANALSEDRDA